jgi:hypothetical protein
MRVRERERCRRYKKVLMTHRGLGHAHKMNIIWHRSSPASG